MKLQIPKGYLKTRGPPPPISYKTDVTIGKKPTDKFDSLKIDIKTQLGERYSETVKIYVPIFWKGSPEALLNFVNLPHKITRGQDLSTRPQKFGMKRNLVVRESL